MSGVCPNGFNQHAPLQKTPINIADGLALIATPIFALMAVLTGIARNNPAEMLCPAMHLSPLSGMALMYVLMSAIHAAPWIRLIRMRFADARFSRSQR